MSVKGVRNSWLMLVKKASFSRLASSAYLACMRSFSNENSNACCLRFSLSSDKAHRCFCCLFQIQ